MSNDNAEPARRRPPRVTGLAALTCAGAVQADGGAESAEQPWIACYPTAGVAPGAAMVVLALFFTAPATGQIGELPGA